MTKPKVERNKQIVKFIEASIHEPNIILLASEKFDLTTSAIYHVCRRNNVTLPRVISTRIDPESHDVHGVHPCLKLGLGFD